MATPINEQIIAVIKTRLESITVANAYQENVPSVDRPIRNRGINPRNNQITVVKGDEEKDEALSHDGNPPAIAWNMPVEIRGILKTNETDNAFIDTLANQLGADIMKAVTAYSAWWNFGGLAINAAFESIEKYIADDGGANGVLVPLRVTYRVSETDPYTARA